MAQQKRDGKLFYFGDEARTFIKEGFETIYKAASVTFGPKGQNVLIEKSYGRPVLTRDGVTVAKESYLEERAPNQGAQMLIETAENTNSHAGDGTTGTIVLGYELLKLGHRAVVDDGANPMDVKQQILEDSYILLTELEKLKKPVKEGQLEQVATVSSGDPLLGRLIAEAVAEVGPDGGIITEKAAIEGVDRTYVSGYFLQQGFAALEAGKKDIENAYIVISAKPISSRMEAIQLLNRIGERAHKDQGLPTVSNGQPVPLKDPLNIAFFGEFEGEAYNVIVANINGGAFDGTITKTPPMGEMGPQYLEDLAIRTGSRVIQRADNLSAIDSDYFGLVGKVSCTTAETTVFEGSGAQEDVTKRLDELKARVKEEPLEAVQEKIRDRISKLEGKVAKFRIGGATETEREEVEFRIEDSIQASRAAAQSGVVPGGGTTLLKLSQTEGIGDVSRQALRNVFKKLLQNANLPAEAKLEEALVAKDGWGFNLRAGGELTDLVAAGILDPYLVLKEIITNAASTAANAVTIGAVIVYIDKNE